jgi:transposase
MRPIRVGTLTPEQLAELDRLYHSARSMRVRTRAQMILLATEQKLLAHQIASIVRQSEETVRRWIKRYKAEGVTGLEDAPQPGREPKSTPEYRARLLEVVRIRPRALEQPFSLWTLQRLADFMAEESGIRLSDEAVRLLLKKNGIVLSRPQHKITSPDPEYQLKKRRSKINATTSKRGRFFTTPMSST